MKSIFTFCSILISFSVLTSQTPPRQGQIHIIANSGVGVGTLSHILLEETEEEFARLRMQNTVPSSFWDIAGICKPNQADAALNFYYDGQSSSGINILSLLGDGNAILTGDLTELSDIRLKRDLNSIKNVSSSLLQLNSYKYFWKDLNMDQSEKIGLAAQEVELYFPQLVKENINGIKSVNYSGFVPLIITALKEQNKEIVMLQEMIRILLENQQLMDKVRLHED